MMLMGYIVLVATNYLGFATIYGNEVLSSHNLLMISVADLFYYIILFEAWSWVAKGRSNASNISLILMFNKKR